MAAAADLHLDLGEAAQLSGQQHAEGTSGIAAEFPAGHLHPACTSEEGRTAEAYLLRLHPWQGHEADGGGDPIRPGDRVQNKEGDVARRVGAQNTPPHGLTGSRGCIP